jgi:DNA-binding NarL/FixJ family response regulator
MIRVVVVSDIRLYREGISDILGRSDSFANVGQADSADTCCTLVTRLRPDVLLLDLALPEIGRIIETLAREGAGTKVVALGVAEDAHAVCACADAGFAAFVPRSASVDDLLASIHAVMCDELYCTPRTAALMFRRLSSRRLVQPQGVPRADLTAREWQIAERLVQGLSNKEIAYELAIELSTVKNHVHHLLEKLQAEHRGQAVAKLRPLLQTGLR